MELSRTQILPVLGLLALPAVVVYALGRSPWPVVLAVVNVFLIAGGLFYMFSTSRSEREDTEVAH